MIIKFIIFFILIIAAIIGCSDDDIPPVTDQTYTLLGKVVDSSTNNPLSGVTVGVKSPDVKDSLIFLGDSLNNKYNINMLNSSFTDTNGDYRMDWFLGYRNADIYDNIFAYKQGYKIWQYKNVSAGIKQTGEFIDELDIRLDPK